MCFLSCVCLELAVCRAVRRMMGMTRTGWCCWGFTFVLYLVSWPWTVPLVSTSMWGGWCLFFAMPCVLCWWVAMATLRRDAVRHRSRWLWVMYVGPTCLLMFAMGVVLGCVFLADRYFGNPAEHMQIESFVWLFILRIVGWCVALTAFPYVWLALVLEYLFLPAPAPRVDEETPQV